MDGADAGRLIAFALDATAAPGNHGPSAKYRDLTERYLADAAFRSLVDDILEGTGCEAVRVDKHHGMLIASDPDGPWAWPQRAADLPWNKNFDDKSARAARMLVVVALLAYVAPSAADFDDLLSDPLAVSAAFTAGQLDRFIRDFAHHKEEQSTDPVAGDAPLWWHWLQLPEDADTPRRTSRRTTLHLVHDVLGFLHTHALLAKTTGANIRDNTYRPRRRLIARCRALLADALLAELQTFAASHQENLTTTHPTGE